MVAFLGKKLLFYLKVVFMDLLHYFAFSLSTFNFKLEIYAFALISREPSFSSYQGVSVPGERTKSQAPLCKGSCRVATEGLSAFFEAKSHARELAKGLFLNNLICAYRSRYIASFVVSDRRIANNQRHGSGPGGFNLR